MEIKELDPKWIKNEDGLPKEAVEYAETFAKKLVDLNEQNRPGFNALTTSKVRSFFGEIRRIQLKGFEKNKSAFNMLKPKLAYSVARERNKRSKIYDFQKVMNILIEQVTNATEYNNFVSFIEATVAYHKAYGGKD